MLVGGNDVQKDDDPGCAGRRSVWAGANKVPVTRTCGGRRCTFDVYEIISTLFILTRIHQCWTCRKSGRRRSAVAAWRMDVKEDPPPANIQIDMHNYDSCPRCRADGEFDTVTALFTGVNMTDFTLYISPIQLESPEREPLT